MSPFLIFAISLTIAYAIYYAVMITKDLYGKKEEAKSNEEVFDISNITEEEAAVAVNESDGGFSVADKQYDTSFQDGTSYDEDYGMGTESNGTNGSSPGTDSSGRKYDVDEDEENDVNQKKPKNAAESLQEKMAGMHDYVVTLMLYMLYLTYVVEFLEIKHNAELFSKLYSKFTKSKAFAIFHYTNKILFLCQQLYHCLYYSVALSLGILLIWSKRY